MNLNRAKLFFIRVPWWRGLLESLLVSLVVLSITIPIVEVEYLVTEGVAFVILVCASYAGLRIRLFSDPPSRLIWKEIFISLAVMLGLMAEVTLLPRLLSHVDFLTFSTIGKIGVTLMLLFTSVGYLLVRITVWLYLKWDRLRRTRFLWGLTSAHLTVVLAVAAIFLVLGILYSSSMVNPAFKDQPPLLSNIVGRILLQVFPWIIITGLFTLAGLVAVLPPSLFFSYLVARGFTRRLESLAGATRALRSGNLAARVPVSGEDELAQLQGDFNAMAADLQKTTTALQAERDKVSGLLQAQRQLTASVSHELRTPVATVRGYLDALEKDWQGRSPEELRQDLETVSREVDHLQSLIDDLFALSRAEVGQLSLRIEPVDLGALAQVVASTVRPLAWNGGRVEVLAEIQPGLPPVSADPGRLEQVIRNLVHNAVRHTPPGGLVVISASAEGDEVRLNVSDTGEGIPDEDLPRIWERFYQSERSRSNGSAGLGLALVKELSEAMGARVGVESKPGEGSRFSVWIRKSGLA